MITAPILGRVLRNEGGASLLEFALVLPVLALMLIALIDFGRATAISMALSSAARAGAEYGALFPQDNAGIQTAVVNMLGSGVTPTSVTAAQQCRCAGTAVADCTILCNGVGSDKYVLVGVNFTYVPILPYPGIASSLQLVGSATFRAR